MIRRNEQRLRSPLSRWPLRLFLGAIICLPPAWGGEIPTLRVDESRSDPLVFTHPGELIRAEFNTGGQATFRGETGLVLINDSKTYTMLRGVMSVSCDKGSVKFRVKTKAGMAAVQLSQGALVLLDSDRIHFTVSVVSAGKKNVLVKRATHSSEPAKTSAISVETFSLSKGEKITLNDKSPAKLSLFNPDELKSKQQELLAEKPPEKSSAPLRLLGAGDTLLGLTSPDKIELQSGEIFFLAPYPVTIQTCFFDLEVPAGGFADVAADALEIRFKSFNLPLKAVRPLPEEQKARNKDDGERKVLQASVRKTGRALELRPGQELLVAAHALSASDLAPPDGIGRRRSEKLDFGENLKAVLSDFSLSSFVTQSWHITAIKHPHNPEQKKVLEKFLKATAALQTVANKYGPYTQVSPRLPRKHPVKTPGRKTSI